MKNFVRATTGAALSALLVCGVTSPAHAQNVNLVGTVANLCVLTLSTPGTLAVSPTGLELSTTELGGLAAVLAVVATGSNPTITITAPTLTGPSAAGSTPQLAFNSVGGANRGYSNAAYTFSANRLLDTITINGKATNANGFQTGLYTLAATATCSQ